MSNKFYYLVAPIELGRTDNKPGEGDIVRFFYWKNGTVTPVFKSIVKAIYGVGNFAAMFSGIPFSVYELIVTDDDWETGANIVRRLDILGFEHRLWGPISEDEALEAV